MKARLELETLRNVSIRVEPTSVPTPSRFPAEASFSSVSS
jgi:hypothetical protein